MHPEAQVIHFGCELIHPPHTHQEQSLREFYFEISQLRWCGCDYKEFRLIPGGAEMATKDGRLRSVCAVHTDRIRVFEDWTTVSLDDFATRVTEIAKRYLEMLTIRVFVVQQAVVRALLTPTYAKDAREFLAEWVCRLNGAEEIFPYFEQRPCHMFGVRLMFPPTEEEPRRFSVRVESYNQDPSRVFTECVCDLEAPPTTEENIHSIEENLKRAYTYATEHVISFLNQFDKER